MTEPRIGELIERAFDYRGFVTLSTRDGSQLVGFVYDRGPSHVDMFDDKAVRRIRLPLDEITDVVLDGEDIAAKAQAIWERRKQPQREPEERPTLILTAMPIELRGVARALGGRAEGNAVRGWFGGARAVALCVGVGGGAAHAVAVHRPGLVVSCGFSGALDPWLRVGDLVLASSVTDELGDTIAAPADVLALAHRMLGGRSRPAEGEILCATAVAATRAEKRELARPGRLAVDLESWSAARAAHRAGIPWLALRVILDPLEVDLPALTREPRASYVLPSLRYALVGGALELVRLAMRARIANRSLEQAMSRLAPAIAELSLRKGLPR